MTKTKRIDGAAPWQLQQVQETDDLQHKRRTMPSINFNVQPSPLALSDKINFGKHKGQTIQELIDEHPTYLEWAVDEIERFALDDNANQALSLALDEHYSSFVDAADPRDFEGRRDDEEDQFVLLR